METNVISEKYVNVLAKELDAEEAVIKLYKKLLDDKELNADKVLFADVTANDLAAALNAAWGCIDILKFEGCFDNE